MGRYESIMRKLLISCILFFICGMANGVSYEPLKIYFAPNRYGYRIYSFKWERLFTYPEMEDPIAHYVDFLINASKQGDTLAMFNLVRTYYYGAPGVSMDIDKAVYWSYNAAKNGSKLSVRYLNDLAERGYPDAQLNFGFLYEFGQGVGQSYAKAAEWYAKAAEQGYDIAQYSLGLAYSNGHGVSQDYVKAVEWYTKSAEQGYADAQCNLGVLYEMGYGVEQDFVKAMELYSKAAVQRNVGAKYNMGLLYEKGDSCRRKII